MPLKIRERDIEEKLTRWAKSHGVLTYKFSSFSHRGVADRIFIGPEGLLFLELKRPKETPTKLQQKFIDEVNYVVLDGCTNINARWVDNVDEGINLIQLYCL